MAQWMAGGVGATITGLLQVHRFVCMVSSPLLLILSKLYVIIKSLSSYPQKSELARKSKKSRNKATMTVKMMSDVFMFFLYKSRYILLLSSGRAWV